MIVTIGFSHKDRDQLIRLGEYLRMRGWRSPHPILIAHSQMADPSGVHDLFCHSFYQVTMYRLWDSDERGWPQSCNHMFRRVAQEMCYKHHQPFLWIEPDVCPLAPDWTTRIESAYVAAGKPFMGMLVNVPNVPVHMSGVAVYPHNALELAPGIVFVDNPAWDVACAEHILPACAHTDLIHHVWQNPKFETGADLERIDKRAVLFHQEKTGSLFRLLLGGYGAAGDPQTGIRPLSSVVTPHESPVQQPPPPPTPPPQTEPQPAPDRLAPAMAQCERTKKKYGKRLKKSPVRRAVVA